MAGGFPCVITAADVGKAVWAIRGIDHEWQRGLNATVEAVSDDGMAKIAGYWWSARDVKLIREVTNER